MSIGRESRTTGPAWLPRCPTGWQEEAIKRRFEIQLGKMLQSEAHSDRDTLVPYLKAVSVQWEEAKVSDPEEMWADPREIGQFGIKDGDLLVCEGGEVGRAAIVRQPPSPCIIQNALHRVRVKREADVRFLLYVLRTAAGQGWFDVLCNRATIAHFTGEKFANLRAHFPDAVTQSAIAAFLDRETARLDGLVAQKEKLLALLEEKRASLITHAITEGLNPNAPTKPSGIPWLGNIPKHWSIQRLQRLVRYGTSITYGIVQAGPDVENGIPYIRTSDMAGDTLPREGYLRTTPEIDTSYRRSKVQAGDLVIAIRATVGKTLPVPDFLEGANLTQGTAKIAPGARVNAGYLYWVLNSQASQQGFATFAKGVTFREITLEMLRKFVVPLPPLVEQKAINAMLVERTDKFTNLVRQVRSGIEKLGERRTALISAAVTGQIDVRAPAKKITSPVD